MEFRLATERPGTHTFNDLGLLAADIVEQRGPLHERELRRELAPLADPRMGHCAVLRGLKSALIGKEPLLKRATDGTYHRPTQTYEKPTEVSTTQ